MARFLLSFVTAMVVMAPVHADDDGITTIYAAPVAAPALKYRLLPDLRDQTTGNALPLYLDAFQKYPMVLKDFLQTRPDNPFNKWLTTPVAELPKDEVRKTLEPFKEILDLLDKAARRERCNVVAEDGTGRAELPGRLPESYYLPEIVTILAVRGRLQMADGDLAGGLHSLQTGFAIARHFGELPNVGAANSGVSAADIMLAQVEEFIQQPRAPNLYWALSDLPRPLVNVRTALEAERHALYRRFPGAANARDNLNAGPMTEEQIQTAVKEFMRYRFGPGPFPELQARSALSKMFTDRYEENKKVLLDESRPKEIVQKLPHIQVALMAAFAKYELTMDEQMKWFNEPFDQSVDHLEQISKGLESRTLDKYLYPIVPIDVFGMMRSRFQLERKIDALRCIEAIRDYASRNGKLPTSLDSIKEVPIPRDLATTKPLVYKLEGDKARLETPELTRENRRRFDDLEYQLLLKKQ